MTYQDIDQETETDGAPWTAPSTSAQIVPARSVQLVPPPSPVVMTAPATSEFMVLGSILQSFQQAQTQQSYLLRDMNARLARLENGRSNVNSTPSFERGTWWAIWGLLMLILGGALVVVIVLILMHVEFR